METKDLQKFAQKIFHQSNRGGIAQPIYPRRDWIIGLCIGMCILVVSVLFSAYTYISYRYAEDLNATIVQVDIPVYKAAVVEGAQVYFTDRANAFEQLQNGLRNASAEQGLSDEGVLENTNSFTATSTATSAEMLGEEESENSLPVTLESEEANEQPRLEAPSLVE